MKMVCYNCAYARPRYDRSGLTVGIDCAHDNLRFIPDSEIKVFRYCPNWVEVDG